MQRERDTKSGKENKRDARHDEDQLIYTDLTGIVKCFDPRKGFGFINSEDFKDVYFHHSAIRASSSRVYQHLIEKDDEVTFDLMLGSKGYYGEDVALLEGSGDSSGDLTLAALKGETEDEGKYIVARDAIGTIWRYFGDKGYGFIKSDIVKRNIFFHHSAITGKKYEQNLQDNDEVIFDLKLEPKGYCAENVAPLLDESTPDDPASDASSTSRKQVEPSVGAAGEDTMSSQQMREQGNLFYKSATGDFGFVVRSGRYEKALRCYRDAYKSSETPDDAVSAAKNIAMTAWKLASLHVSSMKDRDQKAMKDLVRKYQRDALDHFSKALGKSSCKSAEWVNHLFSSLASCAEETVDWLIENMEDVDRVTAMGEVIWNLPDCCMKANLCLQLATTLFHLGSTACQNQQYKECFRFMKECYFPISEAERLCLGDADVISKIAVLKEDVYLHTCIAESGKAKATGDGLLEAATTEQEELNIDLVWDIIDWYKQVVILCRNKDLEQEAVAYSRMGRVYGKILQMSVRGKDCYKKAIELALSMAPRSFHGVDWFEESKAFVEAYQSRLSKEETQTKEKKEALSEMKEDVRKLKELTKLGVEAFVEMVYATWPSKVPGSKFKSSVGKKKMLIRAISHYHPNRIDKEIHGKNWYYFTAEITKCLNEKYAREKFSDYD